MQKQSPQVESNQVELKNIHENNPFKKRKLPADNGQELGQNELLIDLQDAKMKNQNYHAQHCHKRAIRQSRIRNNWVLAMKIMTNQVCC